MTPQVLLDLRQGIDLWATGFMMTEMDIITNVFYVE
jgi:hypothetical protein